MGRLCLNTIGWDPKRTLDVVGADGIGAASVAGGSGASEGADEEGTAGGRSEVTVSLFLGWPRLLGLGGTIDGDRSGAGKV